MNLGTLPGFGVVLFKDNLGVAFITKHPNPIKPIATGGSLYAQVSYTQNDFTQSIIVGKSPHDFGCIGRGWDIIRYWKMTSQEVEKLEPEIRRRLEQCK